jgi:pimeloyl-ACP methyl ester carboxylesterase
LVVPRVLLVVIDAATPRVVCPAVLTGQLPVMQRLAEAGAMVDDCTTIFPSITPAATTSILTGCYRRNYPREVGADVPQPGPLPAVKVPVLMFHGLDDRALHADGLSGTWNWLEKDLTLVTIPGAGHFVQQDAAALVTTTMEWWLSMRTPR